MIRLALSTALVLPAILSSSTFAQDAARTQGNPYETCIAAEVAKNGGGMLAEAKARSACRGRYPDQAAESNRRPPSVPAGLPPGGSGIPGAVVTSTGGGGTTSPSPLASPAPAPISAPSLGGGNPHGSPPGQAKK
jgi:type II secretory pathway pseudopilin PulG